jgi:hypothetical protein
MLNKIADDLYPYLKSSWWGRLLIAAIAIFLIMFAVWSTLNADQKDQMLQALNNKLPERQSAKTARVESNLFTEDELGLRNFIIFTCRDNVDPRKQFEMVRQFESSALRESELASLVVDATCANDESFALELLLKLTSVETKDRALKQVSEEYVRRRQFKLAQKWAMFLSNAQDRDWWTRRVLEQSQKPV